MYRKKLLFFYGLFFLSGVVFASGIDNILYLKKDLKNEKSNFSVVNYDRNFDRRKVVAYLDRLGEFVECKNNNFLVHEQGGDLYRIDLKTGRRSQVGKTSYDPRGEIAGKIYFDEVRKSIFAVVYDEVGAGFDARKFKFNLNRYGASGDVSVVYSGEGEVLSVGYPFSGVIRLYQRSGYVDVNIEKIGETSRHRVVAFDLKNLILIKSEVAFFLTSLGGLEIRTVDGWRLLSEINPKNGFYIPYDYNSGSKKALVVNVLDGANVLFEIDVDSGNMKNIGVERLIGGACYVN